MSEKQKALAAIVANAVISGAVGAVTKVALVEMPPLSFAFLRFLIASLLLLPLLSYYKTPLVGRRILSLVPLSLLPTLNIIFYILGLANTTATISQVLYAGTPMLTALIVFLFLKEKLSSQKVVGIVIGLIGVLLVIVVPALSKSQAFSGSLFGNLLVTIAVMCWSLYMVFSKPAQKIASPLVVTAVFIFTTTIALFPFFLYDTFISKVGWWTKVSSAGIISLLYVVIFATILSYSINQYAIKHGGSVFASMAFYLLPVIGFLSAFMLLGEQLTPGVAIGGIIALVGVFVTTTAK